MATIDEYDDETFIDALLESVDYDTDFPKDVEAEAKLAELDPNSYNLVADADEDCLVGECDHFCGEPTELDLRRMEARGFGSAVEAYENGLTRI